MAQFGLDDVQSERRHDSAQPLHRKCYQPLQFIIMPCSFPADQLHSSRSPMPAMRRCNPFGIRWLTPVACVMVVALARGGAAAAIDVQPAERACARTGRLKLLRDLSWRCSWHPALRRRLPGNSAVVRTVAEQAFPVYLAQRIARDAALLALLSAHFTCLQTAQQERMGF